MRCPIRIRSRLRQQSEQLAVRHEKEATPHDVGTSEVVPRVAADERSHRVRHAEVAVRASPFQGQGAIGQEIVRLDETEMTMKTETVIERGHEEHWPKSGIASMYVFIISLRFFDIGILKTYVFFLICG